MAELYGVKTKVLNQAVKRNMDRFPNDFMFYLSSEEHNILKVQLGEIIESKGGRRYEPSVFTENGVAMLSSVINTPRAIQINISIMRIFTKLRSFLLLEKGITEKLEKLEVDTTKMFKIVFERMDSIEDIVSPRLLPNRRKVGLKKDNT